MNTIVNLAKQSLMLKQSLAEIENRIDSIKLVEDEIWEGAANEGRNPTAEEMGKIEKLAEQIHILELQHTDVAQAIELLSEYH